MQNLQHKEGGQMSEPQEKTIFRNAAKTHFVQIPNELVRNRVLSFKARGVLAMLLSNVDTWEVHVGWIQEQGTEGREAIQGAIRELEEAGYMTHSERPRAAGKFGSSVWTVYDEPVGVNARTNRTKWSEQNFKKTPENHEREAVNGLPHTGNRERETVSGFPATKKNKEEDASKENHQRTKPPETPPQADGLGLDLPEPPEWIKPADRSPEQITVGSWLKRCASTPWSEPETRAWRKITKRTQPEELAEQIRLIGEYYTAKIPDTARDFRRRDVLTLLNNWPGELDRARNFTPNPTPKNEPERYQPKSWK